MSIERFPGTELTPKLLLAQVMEDADEFKSVIVIKEYKDGVLHVAWSRQQLRDVAFSLEYLRHELERVMIGPPEDVIEDAS
jgi:hypothetical protein